MGSGAELRRVADCDKFGSELNGLSGEEPVEQLKTPKRGEKIIE